MRKQAITLGAAVLIALFSVTTAGAQTQSGRLAGVVQDFAGKPQMGATVWIAPQAPWGSETLRAHTNQLGRFLIDKMPVGAYTIRVTLAGYLPTLSRNVVVSANATTVLKLELDSVFSTVAHMRQQPKSGSQSDDWDWVLRSSPDTRTVLRWQGGSDDNGSADASSASRAPRATVELTSGGTEPGVVNPLTQSAFAYDQPIGMYGKLLLAGQFSYDASGTAGLATTWAPFGSSADAPRTTVALQQYRIGVQQGPMLRTLRTEQAGSVRMSERVTIHYTAEYVWVSLRDSTSALHPRADVTMQLSQNWTATVSAGSQPSNGQISPAELQSAVSQLGVFPALMFRNGNPAIGNGWHQELRLEHRMPKNGTLSLAGFRDQSANTAVYATSVGGDPLDALPIPHAVDGGSISTYGARGAYRQKLAGNLEASVVYAWAGVLSADVPVDGATLQELLKERSRNSVALTVHGRISKSGTRFSAGYKWVDGPEVSKQDPYGEALYDADPFLNVSIRQALPAFLGGKKLEAVADLINVLNEGTVYRNTAEGRLGLTPSPRVLRAGLSFQF